MARFGNKSRLAPALTVQSKIETDFSQKHYNMVSQELDAPSPHLSKTKIPLKKSDFLVRSVKENNPHSQNRLPRLVGSFRTNLSVNSKKTLEFITLNLKKKYFSVHLLI